MTNTATRHARPPADEATRQVARKVNKQKIEWVKEVGADPAISSAAARVAAMAALNLAYSKGCIRATHRHLGKLSGLPGRSVRRAVAELAEQYYWEIDATNGGANLYTLITPDERLQLWLDAEDDHTEEWRAWLRAEKQYERNVRQWLDAEITLWLRAEKQFTQEWLDAEKRFTQQWLDAEEQYIREWCVAEIDAQHAYEMQVFNAVLDRCGNTDHAMAVAQAAWDEHRQGRLPLEAALEAVAQLPQESFPAADVATPLSTSGHPPGHQRSDPCPPVATPLSNSTSLNCENDRSTSTYKSDKLEVSTSTASPTGRAPTGAPSGAAQAITPITSASGSGGPSKGSSGRPDCRLCDERSHAISLESGKPFTLQGEDCGKEYWLTCTHSLDGNKRELRRLESEAGLFPTWTGYGDEIDGPDYD